MTTTTPHASSLSLLLQEYHFTLVACTFLISTAAKVLLFPAYRSTDFDVHLHWKSLTNVQLNNLTITDWYFDDQHVDTVHTLDYPPSFAYLEYMWSNNIVTRWLLESWLDAECLELKPSTTSHHSVACVTFMRSTVLVSELVYWVACYVWARMMPTTTTTATTQNSNSNSNHYNFHWQLFFLLSLNPALLWLDHVHFQYNGFLLGILLLSLACLWKGARSTTRATRHDDDNESDNPDDSYNAALWNLAGAILFAGLLTLKHLYLGLALWYFGYLLHRFCFVVSKQQRDGIVFFLPRLILLGSVTVATLVIPFIPFLSGTQLTQIAKRLFPFGRGLVHDYWAGNIWALYMAVQKVLPSLPTDLPPLGVAVILLISLLPGCYGAWMAGGLQQQQGQQGYDKNAARKGMLVSFTYSAMASFMTAYHVHEKAIVTSLLPLTILWSMPTDRSDKNSDVAVVREGLLLFRTQAFALAGLLPLLFPASELAMKLVTFAGYLILVYLVAFAQRSNRNGISTKPPVVQFDWKYGNFLNLLLNKPWQQTVLVVMALSSVITLLDVVPISVFGRFEFVPLALTSVTVAFGLVLSFVELCCKTIALR